ncbi:Uncharacterised protein [Mycobacterium tuberculosis]|uniref:Uncharacterized protein n=3 Tax=Mycobacterium tuberculosis TaxID=1773 RepID=A0A654TH02_MYCTX|nr:Uncharacterised protein [Mycobacterium tuberculosis]
MPRAGHVHGVTGILDSDRERQPRHRGRFHGGVDIVVTAELVGEGAQSGQRGFDTESNRPRTDMIADRDVVTGRDRRVDSDQRPPAPSWILGSHGLALLCMEVLPFIVNHVVLMKSSRIPGPTQPTVVRELVAVGEPSYAQHCRPVSHIIPDHNAAGVHARLRCLSMIRCLTQVHVDAAHFRNLATNSLNRVSSGDKAGADDLFHGPRHSAENVEPSSLSRGHRT